MSAFFIWVHGEWIRAWDKQIVWTAKRFSGNLLFVPPSDSFPMNPEKMHSFLIFYNTSNKVLLDKFFLFCFLFLVHLSRRLKCTIVIMRCPSSVCPSVINFSHFRLLLWNHCREFNETWQEARSQRPLPSLYFSGRSEKQDGRSCLWLAETFSTSPLKPLNGIQRNLIGNKISMSSTKFVFFGPIEKTRWPPWLLIDWDIFDFSSVTAEQNSKKLDRKQDLNVLYQVCVFRADQNNKMAAPASDWLSHFRLLL